MSDFGRTHPCPSQEGNYVRASQEGNIIPVRKRQDRGNQPFLVPFRAFHAHLIDLRPLDSKVFLSVPALDSTKELERYERSGRCWTAITEGIARPCSSPGNSTTGAGIPKILGMGGVVPIWQGVAIAWLLTACEIERYKVFFHKTIVRMLNNAIRELNLHRIDVTVLAEHKTSVDWLERLGFTCEGRMEKFDSQKNDYYRYALIKHLV